METTEKKALNPKRLELIQISNDVKPLVTMGEFENVNEAIIETCYKTATAREFETYNGWLAKGFRVKKGSKGKVIWGRPRRGQKTEVVESDETYKFFPMAFLFSNEDVEPMKPD